MQPTTPLPDPQWLAAILEVIEQHPFGMILLILLVVAVGYTATLAYRFSRK